MDGVSVGRGGYPLVYARLRDTSGSADALEPGYGWHVLHSWDLLPQVALTLCWPRERSETYPQ
jgi:hypothetical protein